MAVFREVWSTIRNFPRHVKSAFQGIFRNGAMSVSSIFAVTITLILVGVLMVVALNVDAVTKDIESKIRIHVTLERDATPERIKELESHIKGIPEVKSAEFSSKEQELDKFIVGFNDDSGLFETFKEDNPLGAAFNVEVKDAQEIQKVAKKIGDQYAVKAATYGGSSTTDFVKILGTVRVVGVVFVIGLVILATFMISNTIKLTITARKTEISIMRLVGASNAYIRVPFMLEGILIGLLGSIIPILVTIYGYRYVYEYTGGVLGSQMLKLVPALPHVYNVAIILASMGALVGLVGSFWSVNRFLKN